MDDDYENDSFDEDLDEIELDEDNNNESEDPSDEEIELAGSLDGKFDSEYDALLYGGYGFSINLDNLTDEQKDLYDDACHAGHDANEK